MSDKHPAHLNFQYISIANPVPMTYTKLWFSNHADQPPASEENAQRPPDALRFHKPSPHVAPIRLPFPRLRAQIPALGIQFSTLDAQNPPLRTPNAAAGEQNAALAS